MFVVVWLWFMAYVATEIGFSTWLPPYATLVGLTSESDAALLTTVYYTAFTITRTLPFIFPRLLSSRSVLLGAEVGGMRVPSHAQLMGPLEAWFDEVQAHAAFALMEIARANGANQRLVVSHGGISQLVGGV